MQTSASAMRVTPSCRFKNELGAALVDHFDRATVKRGNKAFNIRENTYHVEADVVPLFEFRQYLESRDYRAGVALMTDKGRRIENYQERLVEYWPSTPEGIELVRFARDWRPAMQRGTLAVLKTWNADLAMNRRAWDERTRMTSVVCLT